MGCLSHTYCCFSLPLYNLGIYAVLAEHLVIGLTAGVLCLAAPSIDAVAIPSFGSYILAVFCILAALVQGFGFWGIFKEKPLAYKKYTLINAALVVICLILALVWIILSAVRHQIAKQACLAEFLGSEATSSQITIDTSDTSGDKICDIFMWVQLGIMGFLWLFFFTVQMYLIAVTRIYSAEQKRDHAKYASVYSAAGLEIARNSTTWDARNSISSDGSPTKPFMHSRNESNMSKSSLRNEVVPEKGSHAAYYVDTQQASGSHYPEELKSDIYGSYASHDQLQEQYTSPQRSEYNQGQQYQSRQSPTKSQFGQQRQQSPVYASSGYVDTRQSPTYGQQSQQRSPTKRSPTYPQTSPTYVQALPSPSYSYGQQNQSYPSQPTSYHSPSYPPTNFADPYAHQQGQRGQGYW